MLCILAQKEKFGKSLEQGHQMKNNVVIAFKKQTDF